MHPFSVEIPTMKLCPRKSTSSSRFFFFGEKYLLKSTSTTQAVVSLSSAEAEFYAAVKAAGAGTGCVSMMRDLGVALQKPGAEVKAKALGDGIDSPSLEIKLDATAGRAIAMRRGAGRIGHIATPTLWLQRLVINGDSKMTRVGGNDNCADLGAKHLDYQTMNKHLKFCGMRFAEGRSKIAPQLELFWTSNPMSNETSGSQHSATPRHDQRLELGMENLVWRHSPNAQNCDLAWTATSQGGVSKSGPKVALE